jgi:hypothetical protein
MEESSSASQSRTHISKMKPSIAVPKKHRNREYLEDKKAFEGSLWAAVKCTQLYSGGASGTTGSKIWFFPYCKNQKSGSVARVRWHLLGMGKKEPICACDSMPKQKKHLWQNNLMNLRSWDGSLKVQFKPITIQLD